MIKRFIFCLTLLTIFLNTGKAEEKSLPRDERLRIQRNLESKRQVTDSLILVSKSLVASNPEESRHIASTALQINNPDDVYQEIRLLNLTGITYFIQSDYSNALKTYMKALTVSMAHEEGYHLADLYNNIGNVNLQTGNYMDALENFLAAKEYYEASGDIVNKAGTLNNAGYLYLTIENFTKAESHFRAAWEDFLHEKDSMGMAASLTNIGTLYLNMEKPDSALHYLYKAIDVEKQSANKYGLSVTYGEIAGVYESTGDYAGALSYYEKSKMHSREINTLYRECMAILGLARVWKEKGYYVKAIEHSVSAMDIAGRLSNTKLKQKSHASLSLIYEAMGNDARALQHYRSSVELKDSIVDQAKLHQMYNLEIQELSRTKEVQMLEIQRQELLLSRKTNTIWLISIASFFMMAGIYLIYRNYRYRQLASHQKAILDLTEKKSRAAVEAEIRERRRIGQELHDGLGQLLSVARLNIGVMQKKPGISDNKRKEMLNWAMKSVDKAFYELRDISHNLAPSALAEKGLISALKELAEHVNQSQQIQVHLETYGISDSSGSLVDNTLYRAIQELINNAIKHAEASNIFIQLVRNDEDIALIVEDNGKGFDPDAGCCFSGGGLVNMRSRIENLNGSLYIDSMLNRGTIVTISIPV